MDAEEAKQIIRDENLSGLVWYDEPLDEDSVVIRKIGDAEWEVSTTTERAGVIDSGVRKFDSESDMFENMIKRLRAGKRLEDLQRSSRNPL